MNKCDADGKFGTLQIENDYNNYSRHDHRLYIQNFKCEMLIKRTHQV